MRDYKQIWIEFNRAKLKSLIKDFNSRPQLEYLRMYIRDNWLPTIGRFTILWDEYERFKSFSEAINFMENLIIESELTRKRLRDMHNIK